MPIRDLTRYRVICDQCGAHADYESWRADDIPEGWEIDRSEQRNAWYQKTYCPTCSEQRKDEER